MSEESKQLFSIKQWAEDDRPREKLLLKGRNSLSDAELIAILIATGSREDSAVELGKKILASAGNNLNELTKLSVNDLKQIKGIGIAKAITIIAAMELGRRRKDTLVEDKPILNSSKLCYLAIAPYLQDLPHEEFWILLLNRKNQFISIHKISTGGVSATLVDSKIIFKLAIENLASGIVLSHNHPSGNSTPSKNDEELTANISKAAKLFDIVVVDHIIVAGNTYYSFADNANLKF